MRPVPTSVGARRNLLVERLDLHPLCTAQPDLMQVEHAGAQRRRGGA
jgi:hypothetical protein